MRRLSILVCLTALVLMMTSVSSAQSLYRFHDTAAWWDAYECKEMRTILGEADTFAGRDAACKMFADLSADNQDRLTQFIVTDTPSATNEGFSSVMAWWNSLTETATPCPIKQALVGMNEVGEWDGSTYTTNTTNVDAADVFCGNYASLSGTGIPASRKAAVDRAGNALSGRGAMTTETEEEEEEEAPALPLVGVGILGLLLAGRGAWLRRRA